jgi:hypothetical protein
VSLPSFDFLTYSRTYPLEGDVIASSAAFETPSMRPHVSPLPIVLRCRRCLASPLYPRNRQHELEVGAPASGSGDGRGPAYPPAIYTTTAHPPPRPKQKKMHAQRDREWSRALDGGIQGAIDATRGQCLEFFPYIITHLHVILMCRKHKANLTVTLSI